MPSKMKYKSLFNLTGKNAIVTGGCGILGEHFCKALSEFGANVAVVDINEEKAKELASTIQEDYDTRVIGIYCDVSKPDSVTEMVSKVVEEYGNIHILHNNAASKSADLEAFFADFEDYSIDEWRKIMSVNIDGMFLVAQVVGKHMVENEIRGSMVQTSSIYGILASDKRIYEGSHYLGLQISNPAVYSTSKAGVVGLTRYLASYWGDKGIRVNALLPGGVESGQNETFKLKYSARVPLGRMAQGYEMAGALVYLVSDASSYVTGQCIIVDGGLSVW
jgi:NAD(P)-dependent dehydrogenase (short-subunit alcohol dehydrogenase family)